VGFSRMIFSVESESKTFLLIHTKVLTGPNVVHRTTAQ
jgi:hypothetical protein